MVQPSECDRAAPSGPELWVAADGSDMNGDGSEGSPWSTITHALDNAADGSTILVKPGEYTGRIRLRGDFTQGVVVRSEVPYGARLRHDATVVTCYTGRNITLEGFDIAHSGPGAGALVVQIQNLRDANEAPVEGIVLRDNVLHDSYDNDILKINNGARGVTVERNVFYNQTGSDEHIDINSVADVTVQDNVFFNDFAGSGRSNDNSTSSYIVIKDSNGNSDAYVGSSNIAVRRNVFLEWQGNSGTNFVLVGEDGTATFEADGVTVENNLFLGNSSNTMRACFGVKGSRDVLFRNNTVSGDLPSLAFAFRLNTEGSNQPNENVRFYNNVWSDPTGTMDDFSDTPQGETTGWTLANNHYFNGGNALPEDSGELINPSDDGAAAMGDPLLPALSGIVLPRWNASSGMFADGSATTCAVHRNLVEMYGTPASGSPLMGAADASQSPADDILGDPRGGSPDIGARQAP